MQILSTLVTICMGILTVAFTALVTVGAVVAVRWAIDTLRGSYVR